MDIQGLHGEPAFRFSFRPFPFLNGERMICPAIPRAATRSLSRRSRAIAPPKPASFCFPFFFAFKPKSGPLSCLTHLVATQLGGAGPHPLPPPSSYSLRLDPIEKRPSIDRAAAGQGNEKPRCETVQLRTCAKRHRLDELSAANRRQPEQNKEFTRRIPGRGTSCEQIKTGRIALALSFPCSLVTSSPRSAPL